METVELTKSDASGPDWLIPTTIAVRTRVSASIDVVQAAGVIDATDSRHGLDAVMTTKVEATVVSSPPRMTAIRSVAANVDAASQVNREQSSSARSDLVRALVDASTRAVAEGDATLLRVALEALGRLAKRGQ